MYRWNTSQPFVLIWCNLESDFAAKCFQNVLLSFVLKLTGASMLTVYPYRQPVLQWYSIQFLILSTSKSSQKTRNLISPCSRPQFHPRCLSAFCCVRHYIRSDQSQRECPDVLKVSFFLWLIKGLHTVLLCHTESQEVMLVALSVQQWCPGAFSQHMSSGWNEQKVRGRDTASNFHPQTVNTRKEWVLVGSHKYQHKYPQWHGLCYFLLWSYSFSCICFLCYCFESLFYFTVLPLCILPW